MKEIRIDVPLFRERDDLMDDLQLLAGECDLEYDAFKDPILTVKDVASDEILLEKDGAIRCFISGEEADVERFLKRLAALLER